MSECGIMWLAVARKIIMAQKTRVPSIPSGKKVMNMVPPMKSTSIRIGVRKPQIGHMAKMILQKSQELFLLPKEACKAKDSFYRDQFGVLFFVVYVFPIPVVHVWQVQSEIPHNAHVDAKCYHG